MTTKSFIAKRKADLAMIGFVLITLVMLASTSIGIVGYAVQAVDLQQVNDQIQEVPVLSLPASVITGEGG